MKLLKGKTAIITGASRGIGKGIAKQFALNGANVAFTFSKSIELAKEFEKELISLGVKAVAYQSDAANYSDSIELVEKINTDFDSIDILVNNAGCISTSLFQMTPLSKVKEMFDINFFSMFQFTQGIVKSMVKNGGSVVNISSSAAIEGNEGRVSYASSKSAVITFGQVISRELGGNNIRVNTIAPGLTETEMMKGSTPDDVLKRTLDRVSLHRTAKPKEIANVALFLASNLSSYMTGQVLRVDGGM